MPTAIDRLPEVAASAVVGLMKNGEERIHAALILRDPTADPAQIVTKANQRLEAHQRIRSWSVWPDSDFPRTPSTLKILRKEILDRVVRLRSGPGVTKPKQDGGESRLETLLANTAGGRGAAIRDEDRLAEDLGLTSLDRVELLSALEREYSVALDETSFVDLPTVGELKDWLDCRKTAKEAGRPEGRVLAPGPDRFARGALARTD